MRFRTITQLAALAAGAVIAFTGVTACGERSESPSTTTPQGTAMPETGTYIVTMPPKDGQPPMVLAVTVDGERIAAYACNNTNDEAWFFGTQSNGKIDLTSKYLDRLQATYENNALNTTLTMNDVTYTGVAASATPPAGIYTATAGDARVSWIVKPDHSTVGVVSANSKNDREVIDQINAQQQAFKDKVRQARLQRQLQQAAALNHGTWTSTVNGAVVTATRVTGTMTSPPG